MTNTIVIREFASNEWKIYKALRLRSLADSPDAFGAVLAEEQNRPDHEWENRLKAAGQSDFDSPLVAVSEGKPIGLAWGRIEQSTSHMANLYQLWVEPGHRSEGVGSKLLEEVIFWAKAKDVRYLELGVTFRESPAMRLYKRYGFLPLGEPRRLRPGSRLLGQRMRLELNKTVS